MPLYAGHVFPGFLCAVPRHAWYLSPGLPFHAFIPSVFIKCIPCIGHYPWCLSMKQLHRGQKYIQLAPFQGAQIDLIRTKWPWRIQKVKDLQYKSQKNRLPARSSTVSPSLRSAIQLVQISAPRRVVGEWVPSYKLLLFLSMDANTETKSEL